MNVTSSLPPLMANQATQPEKNGALTAGKLSRLSTVMLHCGNIMSSLETIQDRKASDAHELAYFRQQGCEELLLLLEELPNTLASRALKQSLETFKDRTGSPHYLNIASDLKEVKYITPGKL